MAKSVVDGAVTICSSGTMPSVLLVKEDRVNTIKGKNAAHIQDHIPIANILPFGQCTSMANPAVAAALGVPQPCIPITPLPWSPGHEDITIKDIKILTDECICPCIWCGIIGIVDAGQNFITVGNTIPEGGKEAHEEGVKNATEEYKNSEEGQKVVAEAKATADTKFATQKTMEEQAKQDEDEAKALETAKKNDVVEVLYETLTGTFYALTPNEFSTFKEEEKYLSEPMIKLNAANDLPVDPKDSQSINARKNKIGEAKKTLQDKIEPLVHGPNATDITEVVRFKGKKYTYVRSENMKNHRRSYKLDSEIKKQSIMTNGKLDFNKLKKQIQENSDMSLNWNLFESSGSLGEWAESFNNAPPVALYGNPYDSTGHLSITDDAHLLRYSSGATVRGGFNPRMGKVSFSVDGQAEFALAEGKIKGTFSIPSNEGWHMKLPRLDGTGFSDLGAIRFAIEAALTGFAGASVNACLHLDFATDKTTGKLRLQGTNKKDDNGPGGNVGYFLGAKAGCEGSGSIAWKNPEIGMQWQDLATEAASLSGAVGRGRYAEFYIHFQKGKFQLHTKAYLVCGLGATGSINLAVDAKKIYHLLQFVYHKLKNEDFKYIGFLTEEAMTAVVNMFTKYFIGEAENLLHTVEKDFDDILDWWGKAMYYWLGNDNETLLDNVLKLANKINSSQPDDIRFMPPEAKGRILQMLCEPKVLDSLLKLIYEPQPAGIPETLSGIPDLERTGARKIIGKIKNAIFTILSYAQSQREFDNIIQHMSFDDPKNKVENTKERADRLYYLCGNDRIYKVFPEGTKKDTPVEQQSLPSMYATG